MFPIIPLLAIAAIVGGVATLSWYSQLTKEQQYAANKRMNQLALHWFNRRFNELGERQRAQVENQVRNEYSKKKLTRENLWRTAFLHQHGIMGC